MHVDAALNDDGVVILVDADVSRRLFNFERRVRRVVRHFQFSKSLPSLARALRTFPQRKHYVFVAPARAIIAITR